MRILVPVDGSPQSVNAARFLADRSTIRPSDEVEILNVQNPLPKSIERYLGDEAVKLYFDTECNAVFDEFKGVLETASFKPTVTVRYGDAIDEVAAEAEEKAAELIVMGARGQRALTGLLFGSVSRGLLAKSRIPLLILRDKVPAVGGPLRLGLATDGSEASLRAVKFAVENRSLFGESPQFDLIHCGPTYDEGTNAAEEVLKEAGVTYKKVLLPGTAGDAIVKYAAEESLDLIVMGSHGYGNFKALLLGSVATRITAKTDTPLLIIR